MDDKYQIGSGSVGDDGFDPIIEPTLDGNTKPNEVDNQIPDFLLSDTSGATPDFLKAGEKPKKKTSKIDDKKPEPEKEEISESNSYTPPIQVTTTEDSLGSDIDFSSLSALYPDIHFDPETIEDLNSLNSGDQNDNPKAEKVSFEQELVETENLSSDLPQETSEYDFAPDISMDSTPSYTVGTQEADSYNNSYSKYRRRIKIKIPNLRFLVIPTLLLLLIFACGIGSVFVYNEYKEKSYYEEMSSDLEIIALENSNYNNSLTEYYASIENLPRQADSVSTQGWEELIASGEVLSEDNGFLQELTKDLAADYSDPSIDNVENEMNNYQAFLDVSQEYVDIHIAMAKMMVSVQEKREELVAELTDQDMDSAREVIKEFQELNRASITNLSDILYSVSYLELYDILSFYDGYLKEINGALDRIEANLDSNRDEQVVLGLVAMEEAFGYEKWIEAERTFYSLFIESQQYSYKDNSIENINIAVDKKLEENFLSNIF